MAVPWDVRSGSCWARRAGRPIGSSGGLGRQPNTSISAGSCWSASFLEAALRRDGQPFHAERFEFRRCCQGCARQTGRIPASTGLLLCSPTCRSRSSLPIGARPDFLAITARPARARKNPNVVFHLRGVRHGLQATARSSIGNTRSGGRLCQGSQD